MIEILTHHASWEVTKTSFALNHVTLSTWVDSAISRDASCISLTTADHQRSIGAVFGPVTWLCGIILDRQLSPAHSSPPPALIGKSSFQPQKSKLQRTMPIKSTQWSGWSLRSGPRLGEYTSWCTNPTPCNLLAVNQCPTAFHLAHYVSQAKS